MTHSNLGVRDIFLTHLIIIRRSEVTAFPIIVTLSRGRVSGVFCTIICQLLHVDPWKAGVLCPIVLCGL